MGKEEGTVGVTGVSLTKMFAFCLDISGFSVSTHTVSLRNKLAVTKHNPAVMNSWPCRSDWRFGSLAFFP